MKNFQFVLAEGKNTVEALSNLTKAIAQMFKTTTEARITSLCMMPEGRQAALSSLGQPTVVLVVVAVVEFEGVIEQPNNANVLELYPPVNGEPV